MTTDSDVHSIQTALQKILDQYPITDGHFLCAPYVGRQYCQGKRILFIGLDCGKPKNPDARLQSRAGKPKSKTTTKESKTPGTLIIEVASGLLRATYDLNAKLIVLRNASGSSLSRNAPCCEWVKQM